MVHAGALAGALGTGKCGSALVFDHNAMVMLLFKWKLCFTCLLNKM